MLNLYLDQPGTAGSFMDMEKKFYSDWLLQNGKPRKDRSLRNWVINFYDF